MEIIDLPTTGMHCPSCSKLVQMEVGDLDGVASVTADHEAGVTHVEFDPAKVTVAQIVEAIKKAGYGAEVPA